MRSQKFPVILAASIFLTAVTSARAQNLKVSHNNEKIVVTHTGKKHVLALQDELWAAAKIEEIDVLHSAEKDGQKYLVLQISGWSRWPRNMKKCGNGFERDLVWLALNSKWEATAQEAVRVESCWATVGPDDDSERTFTKEQDMIVSFTNHFSARERVKLVYSLKQPEAGFLAITSTLDTSAGGYELKSAFSRDSVTSEVAATPQFEKQHQKWWTASGDFYLAFTTFRQLAFDDNDYETERHLRQQESLFASEYERYLQSPTSDDVTSQQKALSETSDRRLNTAYTALSEEVTSTTKLWLLVSQRRWIKMRDHALELSKLIRKLDADETDYWTMNYLTTQQAQLLEEALNRPSLQANPPDPKAYFRSRQ